MEGVKGPLRVFHNLDLGVRHKLLEDKLHADVAEHDVEKRAHSPTGPAEEANSLPTISLHRELHENSINFVVGTGANHIVQPSMLLDKALRR